MTKQPIDSASLSGKRVPVAETTTLLVVGAGTAGCAAASEAARRGLKVVLVDENPIDFETMANDVPLHFGSRMSGAVHNRTAMTQAVLEASPHIADAFEAGVDVRLSTSCWGLYVPTANCKWPDHPLAGLADADRCWQMGFDYVIVATGCRDLGIAFPGWEAPGVMGARALQRLVDNYGALNATRAVVLGSGSEALIAIGALGRAGVECAAIIECDDKPASDATVIAQIAGIDIPVYTGHVIARAESDFEGVNAAVVTAVDKTGGHVTGTERTIECDTVVLALAPVPAIELMEACGCRMVYDATRSGHIAGLNNEQCTSIDAVYAVGDVAGVWSEKSVDPSIAHCEALAALDSVARALGLEDEPRDEHGVRRVPDANSDLQTYLSRWVTASVLEAQGECFVCQCEEVTARDILEVKPPRYLPREQATQKPSGVNALLGNGPPNPDQVKRLTRAGMGFCQGRRCREQVSVLLAIESGQTLGDVPLATYRPPVRPLSLTMFAEVGEDPLLTQHWQPWFGIATQFVPDWAINEDDEQAPHNDQ